MKVNINYTVEVDDWFRRAIRFHWGQEGLATRDEIRRWYEQNGSSGDTDLAWDLENAEKRGEV